MTENEESRESLLDVVMGRMSSMRDYKVYSRIFYAGLKSETAKNEKWAVKKFHEEVFKKSGTKDEDIYGFMFESGEGFVHVLESSPKDVFAIIQELQRAIQTSDIIVNDVKVLLYLDDIGKIKFPRWAYRDITLFDRNDDDDELVKHADDDEQLGTFWIRGIHQTLAKILRIGSHIAKTGPTQMDLFLNGLHMQHPNFIPKQDTLINLAKCDRCLTLKEFLSVYTSFGDISLEDDLVWPANSWNVTTVALMSQILQNSKQSTQNQQKKKEE